MSNAATVRPGEILAGKYRIDRILGSGAMGVVYEATHLELEQRVAVKLMLPQLVAIDSLVVRFLREARAAAKLKSPHVARVFDVGKLDGGAPYIVMELLEGMSLSDYVEARAPLPCEEATTLILEACHALEEAHAQGIVHRDLKPANMFLAKQPDGSLSLKVLDFGISKIGTTVDLAGTESGALMGSPLYMSPEQMRSARDVDARSDVWSIGILFYKLLTGETPYESDGFGDLILEVHQRPPRPIEELRPDVPTPLRAAIASCLERDLALRCPSVRELSRKLAELAPLGATRLRASLLPVEGEGEGEAAAPLAKSTTDKLSDTVLVESLREAAAAWPGVFVSPARFHVAVKRAIGPNGAGLSELHTRDLYLAIGCLEHQPEALDAFERQVMTAIEPAIVQACGRANAEAAAEATLEKLLGGASGREPKLANYTGRLPLVAWVRVVAVREALRVAGAARGGVPEDAVLMTGARSSGSSGAGASAAPLKESDFRAAVDEAFRGLTPEQRTLLRFHVKDGVPIEKLARMLGIDPQTAAQRIEAARADALARTRSILGQRHGLSPDEAKGACESAASIEQVLDEAAAR